MGAFLLDFMLPLGLAFSLLALVHCLATRKGTAWFLIIVLLGPFGGMFYLAALQKWINFEPPKRLSSTSTTAIRRCPRCQQSVGALYEFEDGRKILTLCAMCKSEMEFSRSGFTVPDL